MLSIVPLILESGTQATNNFISLSWEFALNVRCDSSFVFKSATASACSSSGLVFALYASRGKVQLCLKEVSIGMGVEHMTMKEIADDQLLASILLLEV